MKELIDMFLAFARIGGLTFGGGYAMLPMLQREVVEHYHWATEDELMNYYALGQCTPGVIAVNVATFVGYKQRGIIGAIVASIGVVFPSFVIISIIAACISNFAELALVKHAFAGIRVCVCVLIFRAVLKLWKKSVVDKPTLFIFLLVLICSTFTKITPIVFIVAAGMIGILLRQIKWKEGK